MTEILEPPPSPPKTPCVSFDGVGKSYGHVHAVRNISFDLAPGSTIALLGPNGAGKSTALDILLGLTRPDTGTAQLFGASPSAAIRAGRVGAMLQKGGMMPEITVRNQIRLAHRLARHPLPVAEIMRRADIEGIARHRVDKLSGGEVQRVRFALALAEDPDLLVLDEPTAGMDVAARNQFWTTMRRHTSAGRTVLFATHYMEEADTAADRVLVLHEGQLIADSTPAEMKALTGVRRVTFEMDDPDEGLLRTLPGVLEVQVLQGTVQVHSGDSDRTVEALFLGGLRPRNLEVHGIGLEQAYLRLTTKGDTRAEEAVR